jgi:hypothetical protein
MFLKDMASHQRSQHTPSLTRVLVENEKKKNLPTTYFGTMSFTPLLTEDHASATTARPAPVTSALDQLRAIELGRTPEQKKAWKLAREADIRNEQVAEASKARKAAVALVHRCYRELDAEAMLATLRTQGTKRPQVLYEQVTHIGAAHIVLGGSKDDCQVNVNAIPSKLSLKIATPHALAGALIYFSKTDDHERGRDDHPHIIVFRVTLHTDIDYNNDARNEPTHGSCVVQ